MQPFQDNVVLITGASGNLGTATAARFAREGARLALLDRDAQRLKEIETRYGPHARGFTCDLIDPDSVGEAVAAAAAHFGRIDTLANIAGGFTMGPPLQDTPDKDWDLMMDLNLRTVFNTCRATLPHMLEQGAGRIINIAARAAVQGKGRMGPYCASKAGVITLTESLAAENRHTGINVNCILPGTIDTPQNRKDMPDADHETWVPPEALADVIAFLASDAARCVSGAAIPVYGRS